MATINPTRRTTRGLGQSDTATLEVLFPGRANGPFSLANYDVPAEERNLVNGVVVGNPDVPNFDLDYGQSPTITDWHPNPASPSVPGSVDPADKPSLPPGVSFPASGFGSQEQPSRTATAISGQDPISPPPPGESLGSVLGHPGQ